MKAVSNGGFFHPPQTGFADECTVRTHDTIQIESVFSIKKRENRAQRTGARKGQYPCLRGKKVRAECDVEEQSARIKAVVTVSVLFAGFSRREGNMRW